MPNHRRKLSWLFIALLTTASLLSACGQKGDLYLPDDQKQEEEQKG